MSRSVFSVMGAVAEKGTKTARPWPVIQPYYAVKVRRAQASEADRRTSTRPLARRSVATTEPKVTGSNPVGRAPRSPRARRLKGVGRFSRRSARILTSSSCAQGGAVAPGARLPSPARLLPAQRCFWTRVLIRPKSVSPRNSKLGPPSPPAGCCAVPPGNTSPSPSPQSERIPRARRFSSFCLPCFVLGSSAVILGEREADAELTQVLADLRLDRAEVLALPTLPGLRAGDEEEAIPEGAPRTLGAGEAEVRVQALVASPARCLLARVRIHRQPELPAQHLALEWLGGGVALLLLGLLRGQRLGLSGEAGVGVEVTQGP